ncbi:low-specificity L-threonine aldolase [Devosia sp. YIM 151766]|uniref:low-specificity L-threonine aldolase n=1 Tax=Devosia sp. YIM 151766 TaxID=3017325 RepID=UPI00255C4181|nr:low-specificity L-threonine aldolase [Devosia sp. YIM 151766]WIY51827.1 low-specificity L-threonine aldolase [Devosia sp. YIM 151766]
MNVVRHDFRSDTVTRPSIGMRAAMAEAEVGDDVYGEDPTVNLLEQRLAGMLGKDAALFVPSGTQSNLLALMSHCGRGEGFIAGQDAHCYKYEAGGAAVLGSIQPQPIVQQPDGTMALDDIEADIKSGDSHFATTRMIALENTYGGRALPMRYMEAVADLADRYGLGLHLDGARAFNACAALGVGIAEFTARFDTVSICLSKGLGAPVGSVLAGRADLIETARRHRKMLGGGMRQAGILAAAGLYALDNNIARLADDHRRARMLAAGLARHEALRVTMPDTNIVWVDMDSAIGERLTPYLASHGVAVSGRYGQQRWVTHLDVGDADIEQALNLVDRFFLSDGNALPFGQKDFV